MDSCSSHRQFGLTARHCVAMARRTALPFTLAFALVGATDPRVVEKLGGGLKNDSTVRRLGRRAFDSTSLHDAVNAWTTDPATALEEYGPIGS